MRIIHLQFYLLVYCGAAEGFTEKLVDLGQNVTLKCEVSVKNVYWFLMKPSERPVFILRSFSSYILDPQYSNPTFSRTFSLQYNSSLFIHNISTNELGVYYCIQTPTGLPPNISIGIRLYIRNHSVGNQTSENNQSQNQTVDQPNTISHLAVPLIISVIMNGALAVVVTVCHCRRTSKTQMRPSDPGFQLQDHPNHVYDQVQNPRTNGYVRTTNVDSLYVLLQHPTPQPEATSH